MSGQKPTLPGIREVFPEIFGPNGQRQPAQHYQTSTGTSTSQPPRSYPAPTQSHAQHSQPSRSFNHAPQLPPPMAAPRHGQPTNPPRGNHITSATARRDEEGAGSSQQTPEDKKRYACHICDMRFVRPSSLSTHLNSHTGEQPFPCTYPGCTKAFSVKSNMQRHLKTVHQQT